eukprot:TRINITY_DN6758_c1_g1_i1.p1 TRINITY_DN6758_c1_g1~~TRINITY_DN6758_c1_g1_i1.p1  ORF type:complete len:918 (+),score=233.46 TRINITY_DN6758_c1_g1_i1:49-2802(+)
MALWENESKLSVAQFEQKLEEGLKTVARVLDVSRNPQPASDVHHKYNDKYLLAEFVTAAATSATLTSLEHVGLTEQKLRDLKKQSGNRTVTLRFDATSSCEFLKKTEREIEGPEHRTGIVGAITAAITSKSVTKVTEYHWEYKASYVFSAYFGSDPNDGMELSRNEMQTELTTSTNSSPQPATSHDSGIDLTISWIINKLDDSNRVLFSIDRRSERCHTPRRNPDIESAISFYKSLREWTRKVIPVLHRRCIAVNPGNNHVSDDHSSLMEGKGIFVPVLPLLEDTASEGNLKIEYENDNNTDKDRSVLLPKDDLNSFLTEHGRSLEEKLSDISKAFPTDGLVTSKVAQLMCLLDHIIQLSVSFYESVDYIESMLYKQLAEALGKVVTATDFREYMSYHARKIMSKEFEPRPFSFAIRKQGCTPEGFFAIEQVNKKEGEIDEPVLTSACSSIRSKPIRFALNASSEVTFTGTQHIHSLVNYRFTNDKGLFNLVASSRQFSGYILMIGRIGGSDLFLPTHSLIVQNKDDLTIPLMMEEVPSAKQFKKAIDSMSPEQQRFAKAYRSMQLESTLFGCCVINIRPQLERVLNLPEDSLTKEIALTQDITNLFIEYQISADLLSYQPTDVSSTASVEMKVKEVKSHVDAMKEMIETQKREELEKEEQKKKAAKLDRERRKRSLKKEWGMSSSPQGCSAVLSDCLLSLTCDMSLSDVPLTLNKDTDEDLMDRLNQLSNNTNEITNGKESNEPVETDPLEPLADQQQEDTNSERDISKVPDTLEQNLLSLDIEGSLRPTIIKMGDRWSKRYQKGLLSKQETSKLGANEQKAEHKKAFDLLDSLTRSGVLPISDVDLHVVIASTHVFDLSLLETIIQQNVNPIEKVERSILIAAGVVYDQPVGKILAQNQIERISEHSPQIFDTEK